MTSGLKETPNWFTERAVRVLRGDEVYAFLRTQSTTILYASPGADAESVHPVIRGRFLYWREPPIPIVAVDLTQLKLSPVARGIVSAELARLNLKLDIFSNPPFGYYLLAGTTLVGYHPASVDFQSDQVPLIAGVAGLVAALATSSLEFARLGAMAATWPGAVRAADFFEEYLRNADTTSTSSTGPREKSKQSTASSLETPQTRLRAAYATLGITMLATDEDVIAAHKKLVMENHPDRCRGDSKAIAAATRRTAEINVARDVILGRRR